MVLRKFSEITSNKSIFSQYNIFYKYKYFFFQSCFDLFSIIAKKVDQIRSNVVCVVARLVFVFYCALTTGRYNVFQHIFGNNKKSEIYGRYFQTMLFLVTMILLSRLKFKFDGKENSATELPKHLRNRRSQVKLSYIRFVLSPI